MAGDFRHDERPERVMARVIGLAWIRARKRARRKPTNNDLPPAPAMALRAA